MDIYFLNLNDFPQKTLNEFISAHKENIGYSDKLKQYQHYAGKYLLKYVLNNEYGINEFETEIIEGKPYLKNLPYYFSISHSKNLVGLAIGEKNLGFDIEYNKTQRAFEKIAKRYNKEINGQKEFYEFWTKHEAQIKLKSCKKDLFFVTGTINDDFTYSVACEESFVIYNFNTINV